MERDTLNFFIHQIRTWRVQFFGDLRVAVSVFPPSQMDGSATVRELALAPDGELEIHPHFEFYKGLDSGQPQPVPLEIRLHGDTPMMEQYKLSITPVYSELFPGPSNNEVIVAGDAGAWTDALRDFGRLHRETRLKHTLVIQVDEYWSFNRSEALRPQARYFLADWRDDMGSHEGDPLEVFAATLADREAATSCRRFEPFIWKGYESESVSELSGEERRAMDRVPFMSDFGFLLCNSETWTRARNSRLFIANEEYDLVGASGGGITVGDVWDSLLKVPREARLNHRVVGKANGKDGQSLSSWRFFMEAAVLAAKQRAIGTSDPAPAFDLPIRRGESLVCLVLEMWASEVYEKFRRNPHYAPLVPTYFKRFTRRSWVPSRTRGLIGLIAEPEARGSLQQIFAKSLAHGKLATLTRHSLELFKALLLLCDAIDLSSFVGPDQPFRLKSRPVNSDATCARHWYTTACEVFAKAGVAGQFVPVRLPGHFSVRGDSYLAVARGSHSSLLADRALDLLSSRRGNHERLRAGLGLPVRDIADSESGADPRTPLTWVRANGRRDWIRYRSLMQLGADNPSDRDESGRDDFHWLWRSSLGDYDAQSRSFQHGLTSIMEWWNGLEHVRSANWKSGIHLYDAIERYYSETDESKRSRIFDENFAVYHLWEFAEICDEIVDRLKRATPRR